MPQITFRQDTCTVNLFLEKLCDLPLANVRKLYAMMLSDPDRNAAAIAALGEHLETAIADSKAAWAQASREYQDGWRLVPNKRSRTPAAVETLTRNKQLTRAVRRTKAQHERWVKLKALWVEAQN